MLNESSTESDGRSPDTQGIIILLYRMRCYPIGLLVQQFCLHHMNKYFIKCAQIDMGVSVFQKPVNINTENNTLIEQSYIQ